MTLKLIIVESPNKCKTINEMFKGQLISMATAGHICDLPASPQEGIGIDRLAMKGLYELTEDKHRHTDGKRIVAKMKKYLKDNPGTEVYLATDADREGESISAFVLKYLGLKNPKRMKFHSITKKAIEKAFNEAGQINFDEVACREARRLIDRIIGYTASPILRRAMKEKNVSAGRVQTAVDALLVERERKIRSHKPETYFTVHFDMGGWSAEWKMQPSDDAWQGPKRNSEYDIDTRAPQCFDGNLARAVASERVLSVNSCVESSSSRLPPAPLYTISMIQLANRVLDWDAEKTMQIAQKLFEGDGAGHGHITYHRTDDPNIDPDMAAELCTWLRGQGLPVPPTPNRWQSKNEHAQEGHEAIRPTYFEVEVAGATPDQQELYKLIRARAIFSQLAPASYAVKTINLCDATTGLEEFTATAREMKEAGWLGTVHANTPVMSTEDEPEEVVPTRLPTLTRGSLVNIRSSDIRQHTTKAPPRYTILSLTSKLEKLSIGRPSTIATLLKNVATRATVNVRKDKKLEVTPLGERCYDVLYPRFAFAHIGYTAELERALDQIAQGKLDGQQLARTVWDRLDVDCAAIS